MRDIKFRGINNGKWIYGSLLHRSISEGYYIGNENHSRTITELQVTPETVGEYTGLKDKNGKEIYEGDIVKLTALQNDHNQRGAIEKLYIKYFMGNPCLCFEGQETGTPIYPLIVNHVCEIIGNIHENPELLS